MLDQKESTVSSNQLFLKDVLWGLRQERKSLPCKYFYDERGSKLFEQICGVEEYYLTDCELEIMRDHAADMAVMLQPDSVLVEFGSGSSIKTRYLLESIDPSVTYIPVDVSGDHLKESAESLEELYPHIRIEPVVADFTQPIDFPDCVSADSAVTIYFPGSTIGNFEPKDAAKLFRIIVNEIGSHGGLILGIDLQKDPAIIEAAYNDQQGVTVEFNLNLLHRINRELDGDLDVSQFEHQSVYNQSLGRIETSIVSRCFQEATIAGETFRFAEGEEIHTEYSYKYTLEQMESFAAEFGLNLQQHWLDSKGYFAVLHLTVD